MTSSHSVQQGECLSTIAARYGVTWRQLWEAPDNAALRAKRKSPDILHPGDEVVIPDPAPARVKVTLDATTKVVRRSKNAARPLELTVLDAAGRPLADKAFKLALVGGSDRTGRTDAKGVVRVADLPVDVRQGTLEVEDLRFELDIGDLNPLEQTDDDGLSGAQARLRNLGYRVPALDGAPSDETSRALRRFQKDEALEVTGDLDAKTRERLREKHGC